MGLKFFLVGRMKDINVERDHDKEHDDGDAQTQPVV
jgi:hypothetical protein